MSEQTQTVPTTSVESSHRVSIVAKYLGPTNYRGSRIKVRRGDHQPGDDTLTVGWDHALGLSENYDAAIAAFVAVQCGKERDWSGRWIVGSTVDGYVAVWAGRMGDAS